ncbi:MAG: glycerophosphodiester phosphodiesterase [Negativicutes bacterium]|nr:glycerophosphodiester phosphodiesterase [Negativicutes bacterium]MBP8628591.1 glycerophosphodiester phosphodiesterase [Negativicutes bacterium]MBP9537213.1 glycerophosphodiester phosphodiesterase [Negativicutes bacterium]
MISKKMILKKLVLAGLTAAVIGTGFNYVTMPEAAAKVKMDSFDFQSHRGGRDARPENTLYSYAYAMEIGATTIECDMQMTKDGVIVMSHNPILNPDITKDSKGNYVEGKKYDIRLMNYSELQEFTVGSIKPGTEYYEGHGKTQLTYADAKIPTLEEVFQLIKEYGNDKVIVNAETKSYVDPIDKQGFANNVDPVKFVTEFNRLVKKYNMQDRVTLQSFDWRTITSIKKINPEITTVALWCQQPSWGRDSECLQPYEKGKSPWLGGLDIDDYKGNPVQAAKAIGADVISPYFPELSKEMIEEAHSLGMKVVPWTVNTESDMEMLIDMGVDGIITDKPWILRPALEKRGIKLPEPTVNINSKYHTGIAFNNVKTEKLAGGMDAAY